MEAEKENVCEGAEYAFITDIRLLWNVCMRHIRWKGI